MLRTMKNIKAYFRNRRVFLICICSIFSMLVPYLPTHAQGFMVKPMRIEFIGRPGKTVQSVLEIRNTSYDKDAVLDIQVLYLIQVENGSWRLIESNRSTREDIQKLSSCVDWIKLSTETIAIPPMETGKVTVSIVIPPGTRGIYSAGLYVNSVPELKKKTIAMAVRFLIPILLQIQGPPARKRVELTDARMEFIPSTEKEPSADRVFINIENSGDALARVSGKATIFRQIGERWRRVTQLESKEKIMIPGVAFDLVQDCPRRLPSGRYRLDVNITVDGRSIPPLSKQIDYDGDPSVTTVASDVKLMLDPTRLEIQAVPGASRNTYITVLNPTDEELELSCSIVQPKELINVAAGKVLGDHFSCSKWTNVSPAEFTLRAGAESRIRVQLAYPKYGTEKPCYYSTLSITATYPDGQNAGNAEALILARNQKKDSTPRLQGMGIYLAREEGDEYAITAVFGNVGDIYLNPFCKGTVTDASEMNVVQKFELSQETGLMLPISKRRFNGVIDFGRFKPGVYKINAIAEFAGQSKIQKINVHVTRGPEYNLVEVIE